MAIDTTQLLHGKSSQGIQTSDDRRALLGVYYFTGKLSSSLRRLDFMQWTQHLEDCCEALTTAAEYPSDTEAVHAVRLQRIVERYSFYNGAISPSKMPIRTYVRCIQDDLRQFRQSLPSSLAGFDTHIQHAEIELLEPIQVAECETPIERADALHSCLEKIEAFMDNFSKQSPSCLRFQPFLGWIELLHVILALARLSFLVVEGWDLHYLRASKMNFATMISRLLSRFDSLAQQSFGDSQTPTTVSFRFSIYAEKLRLFKKWYEAKVNAEAETQASSASDLGSALPSFDPSWERMMEGFDDRIWTEFMADLEAFNSQY